LSEQFFRSFYGQQMRNAYQKPYSTSFYFNGVDISGIFSSPRAGYASNTFSYLNGFKSVYEQTVPISLKELYSGVDKKEFVLRDTIIQRYRAAFRGGIGQLIVLRGLLTSFAVLLRTSLPVSLLFLLGYFHWNIPRPQKRVYRTSIKQGWKAGTRLKFQEVEPGFVINFVLKEQKNDRFVRAGDNLLTHVTISSSMSRNGCDILVDTLDDTESIISLTLKPNQIHRQNEVVVVKGKGWPKRGGGNGDLLVKVNVVSDARFKNVRKKTTFKSCYHQKKSQKG